jgi:glycine hydroxymethyltransferase
VGTPAITTRGMREAEMAVVGRLIGQALDAAQDDAALARVKGQVKELAQGFPLYASRLK